MKPGNPDPMAKLTPLFHLPRPLDELIRHREEWRQRWGRTLDRLEEFASTFGRAYVNRLDAGILALGSGVIALVALAFWQ
jgi:hypothetical protein